MDDRILLAARRRAAADQIVIENSRAKAIRDRAFYLMEHASHNPKERTMGTLLVAPSQTGKSTALKAIVSELNTPEALGRGELPVVFVTLDEKATRKQLAQNIAAVLEDHGYFSGPDIRKRGGSTESDLLRRIRIQLPAVKCRLLILDEFHQIKNADNNKTAYSVGEAIKRFLIAGICPVIMSGLEDARTPFTVNEQLRKRCLPEIELKKLDILEERDADLAVSFLERYLGELEKRSIVQHAMDLCEPKIIGGIIQVTDGVLGDACNLLKDAIDVTTLDGRSRISLSDLALATQTSFAGGENPFRNLLQRGVREKRAA